MTVFELMAKLGSKGIKLWLEDGQLRFKAPKGALTPELKEALVNSKQDVIEFLTETRVGKDNNAIHIPKLDRSQDLALSFAQQRLWFIDQFDQSAATYNIPSAMRMKGHLKLDVLQSTLDELVKRHEILRTVIRSQDGVPKQVINAAFSVNLQIEDLSHLSEQQQQQEIQKQVTADAYTQFDLANGPLFNSKLLKLSTTSDSEHSEHILLTSMHHIISDGWSIGVFVKEFVAIYTALSAQQKPSLANLDIQYADYAAWQREWLSGDRLQQQMEFWKKSLHGVPVLELPTDRPRPAVQTSAGSKYDFLLSKELTRALNQLSQQQGSTLFMVLLSAYNVLLYRFSRQDDFAVGTPVAGRSASQLENLIGFFVNTIAIRSNIQGDIAFTDFLKQTQQTALACFNHQDTPFEFLVKELAPERDMSHSPLFQVMFSYENTDGGELTLPGLRIEGVPPERKTANFELTLTFAEREGQLFGELAYKTDLYNESTIRQMADSLTVLLNAIVQTPNEQLNKLAILDTQQRLNLITEWESNQPHYDLSQCVHQHIEKQVALTPAKTALIYGEASLTYEVLNHKANALAEQLIQNGIQSGDYVPVLMTRSLEVPIALIAVMKAGGAFVPLDVTWPTDRMLAVLKSLNPKTVLTNQALEYLRDISTSVIEVRGHLLPEAGTQNPNVTITPNDPIYVIYTSGSTGVPKGAINIHRGICHHFLYMNKRFGCTPKDVVIQASYHTFDSAMSELFWPLMNGATTVIPETTLGFDLDYIVDLIAKQKVTITALVPSIFNMMADALKLPDIKHKLHTLRYALIGGEAMTAKTTHQFMQRLPGCKVTNTYGPSECSIAIIYYDLPERELDAIPIGRPIDNVYSFILDEQLNPVPKGVPGELYLGGVCVGAGYFHNDTETQKAFIPSPFVEAGCDRLYKTGDLAKFAADGNIQFLGRMDFQVKLHGRRIELGEIETNLNKMQGVHGSVVQVKQLASGGKHLIAYIVAEQGEQLSVLQLKEFAQEQLPDYMVPAAFVLLPEFPLTPNGKINLRALPEPKAEDLPTLEYVAPATETEKAIANIWRDVLKLEQVGRKDNFFGLGGHSLIATQVVSRIRQALQLDVPLKKLFEHPTLQDYAAAVDHIKEHEQHYFAPPITPQLKGEDKQLSFAQHRLWFIEQLNPNTSTYNIPAAIRIEGNLDAELMSRVFAEVVERHQVLRTNFRNHDGVPELILNTFSKWPLPVTDISMLKGSEQDQELERIVAEDAEQPFDLEKDPLFKTRLIKLAEREYALLVSMHHIVADGWSIGVLIQEVSELYEAFSQNQPSPLPALPIQYSDFAAWQREWMQGEVLDTQLHYWKKQLAGAPDVLRLPTDHPRPKQQTFNGAHYPIQLGKDLSEQVHEFCQQHGLTPFMVLHGAYHVLLSRYANQQDICVGIPIAGRNHAEIEPLIGFFINGLVIRSKLDGNPSVIEYFEQIKEVALGAFAHQDMPADILVDALQFERSSEHAPGAQIGFALQNTPQEEMSTQLGELTLTPLIRKHKTAKYELSLLLQEIDKEISGVMEYNTDLFERPTIAYMMEHYTGILRQMVSNPERALDNINMLESADLYQLLGEDPNQTELARFTAKQRDMYLDSLVSTTYGQNCTGFHCFIPREIDLQHFADTIQYFVNSSKVLRARIISCDVPYLDMAYLAFDRQKQAHYRFEDLSSQQLSDEEINQRLKQIVYRPWPFNEELTEFVLIKQTDSRYYFVATAHHMLVDGIGFGIIADQLLKVYSAIHNGNNLPPLTDNFDQYISENRTITDNSPTLSFWQQQLRAVEALDFSVPEDQASWASHREQDDQGETTYIIQRRYDADLWAQIKSYCRKQRLTPALFFKALYALLIHNYCRSEADFTIMEFLSGRSKEHLNTIGCYFQTMPFVVPAETLKPGESIAALYEQTRVFRKAAAQHEAFSDLARSDLLPQGRLFFSYNFLNFIPDLELDGQTVPLHHYSPNVRGPVELVVETIEGGQLNTKLTYLPSLFADLNFLDRLHSVCLQIISGKEKLSEISLLLKEENFLEAAEWQPEQAPAVSLGSDNETLVDLFETQALETPDTTAVIHGDKQLSYRELNQRANQLAHYLIEKGLKPGDRVGICMDRNSDMLVAVLGTLKARGAYIPMDASYPEERLNYLLEDAQAPMLLTQQCVAQRLRHLSESQCQLLELDTVWNDIGQRPVENLADKPKPEDLIYIIYTSGSTGKPKGAGVYHRGENNLQRWYCEELELTANHKSLLVSAFGFDLTQKNLFANIITGGTLVIPNQEHYDPQVLIRSIHQHQITTINCAPSAFYPLVEELLEQTAETDFQPLSSLQHLVLGGEPIQLSRLKPWLDSANQQCRVMNSYGPTECTDVVAFHWLDQEKDKHHIPIGKGIGNVELLIVNEHLQPLPPGMVGELCVAGICVGAGYINREELTAQSFIHFPAVQTTLYKTGDLARFNGNGTIEYMGRKDFQIKLRGLRIELGEIETALKQLPEVRDGLVLLMDEQLIAYVVTQAPLDSQQWKSQLLSQLPDYMVPSALVELAEWPLTPNGKIDRKALPKPNQSATIEYVAPRNETEEKLATIWSEVLAIENVGIHNDFFDLGGNSLLAARAAAKLRNSFDVEIELRALFELHTIAEIADYIAALQWAVNSAQQAEDADKDSDEGRVEGFL